MRRFFLSIVAMIFTVSIYAQSSKVVSVDIMPNNFTEINAASLFNVILVNSKECKVRIECPEYLKEKLDVTIKDSRLNLNLKSTSSSSRKKNEQIIAYVEMPYIETLELSGAAVLKTKDKFKCYKDFNCKTSGATEIKGLKIEGKTTNFTFSGASIVDMDVDCDDFNVDMSGASEMDMYVIAYNSKLELSGASKADLNMRINSKTYVTLSGSAEIIVYGSTNDFNLSASGNSYFRGKDFVAERGFVENTGIAVIESNIKSNW